MSLTSDLVELGRQLQQEHLFVTTEREQLQRLYHNVTSMGEQLFHTAWIVSQQKLNLQQFMGQDIHTEVYARNNQLEAANFLDSYKVLSYHDSRYGELLRYLYERPMLMAQLLLAGEESGRLVGQVLGLAVHALYGNCLLGQDEVAVLKVLHSVLETQVGASDNPRRLLRRPASTFPLLYRHVCESLTSSRIFLTAALHDPIMRLLMEDEWFFDIDPDKAFVRFPAAEKLRRFGEAGTEEHSQKRAQYRAFIVDKLVDLAGRFIASIKASIDCFPAGLGWLVSQVYRVLTERGKVDQHEIRASCSDLVFALFICPAICDPEPHGITSDVPISHIARHNLMQMAQIIQVLALSQWEEIDPKVRDLYGRFEKGCMSSVLDLFLEGSWDDVTLQAESSSASCFTRSAVLLTSEDVRELVGFLKASSSVLEEKTQAELQQLLSAIPTELPSTSNSDTISLNSSSGVYTPPCPSPDAPGTPTLDRKLFKSKNSGRKKKSTAVSPNVDDLLTADAGEGGENKVVKPVACDVLVLTMYQPGDCPGMLSEKKVLASVSDAAPQKVPVTHSVTIATPPVAPNPEIQEKRTRFSLSHDQESIGNASDYQEAISEAASSHSVEDDDPELETEDNFSDMMSANVSGRDTPLSQAGSVEDNNPPAAQLPVPVPETVRKQHRVDVTERFGKFEIKAELALERDECKSTVSDTWSTDVLASDSEPPEANQVDRLEEVAEEMGRPGLLLAGAESALCDLSETASDAWSTDVLASDTDEKHSELLRDLEQDLLGAPLDREDADTSLNNEEGEEPQIDLEHFGAVGGRPAGPSSDPFPDVFLDDGAASNISANSANSSSSNKRTSGVVLQQLQLPSGSHRSKQTESGASSSSLSGSGARSKLRDRRGVGEDTAVLAEFDPLGGSGGRKNSRDKAAVVNRNKSTQHWVDHPSDAYGSGTGLGADGTEGGQGAKVAGKKPASTQPQPPQIQVSSILQNIARIPSEDQELVGSSDTKEEESEDGEQPLSEQNSLNLNERRLSSALTSSDTAFSLSNTTEIAPGALGNLSISFNDSVSIIEEEQESGLGTDLEPASEPLVAIDGIAVSPGDDKDPFDCDKPRKAGDSGGASAVGGLEGSTVGGGGGGGTGGSSGMRPGSGGFLRSMKDRLHKGIKKKNPKAEKDIGFLPPSESLETEVSSTPKQTAPLANPESTDDILAKYRTPKKPKGSLSSSSNSTTNNNNTAALNNNVSSIGTPPKPTIGLDGASGSLAGGLVEELDTTQLELTRAFQDAKRKLRLVLSTADLSGSMAQVQSGGGPSPRDNPLLSVLHSQLAEAINLQNRGLITQLYEVIRCLGTFDTDGCKRLLRAMQEDYRGRAAYVSYLVRCRQGLLATRSQLQRLLSRVSRDKEICSKHLTNLCARHFLEKREKRMWKFIAEFQKLTMADEKIDLLEQFLQHLYHEMGNDAVWKAASDPQIEDGQQAIERYLMSRIYTHAMFPNGDGDIMRDQVLQEHLRKLGRVVTPSHKDLRIPRSYLLECPWPAAQKEIYMINAYRTPQDKIACVLRCSQAIMNLLSMASERSVPAADDFMPVLIFVLIQANPFGLLSTVQYVNSFYGNRLAGEEQYWWLQMTSAIEFIKTMDYSS